MNAVTNQKLPTSEQLRAVLDYDHETGSLRWKKKTAETEPRDKERLIFNINWGGKSAFTSKDSKLGYLQGKVSGKKMWAHRVVWALHHGYWPDRYIGFRNNVRTDLRIKNLYLK